MIKIGLLGAGRIGAMHSEQLEQHPQFELVCVYDAHREAAQKVASALDGVAVAQNEEEVFTKHGLDAVLIASPTKTHCDFIQRAANLGIAVLCEKPLALDIATVEQCRANLAKDHAPIQLGFNRRFDPGHEKLRKSVKSELNLEKLIITSRDPSIPSLDYLKAAGGLFKDMMIHDFDMALSIMPEDPITIFATGSALVDADICRAADDIDTAMAILRTEKGVLCCINCSRRAIYGYDQRIEAFGAEGMFISDNNFATNVVHYDQSATKMRETLPLFFIERYKASYGRQLDAFAQVVAKGAEPKPSFEDGFKALVLAELAERSYRTGEVIPVRF